MGHCGLALSTTIAARVNFSILYGFMAYWHNLHQMKFFMTLIRCSLASVILGLVCWLSLHQFHTLFWHASFLIRTFSLLFVILYSGLIYLFVSIILRVEAALDMFNMVRRKLGWP